MTLVMRELTALTSSRQKFVEFVYPVFVEFNSVFVAMCLAPVWYEHLVEMRALVGEFKVPVPSAKV